MSIRYIPYGYIESHLNLMLTARFPFHFLSERLNDRYVILPRVYVDRRIPRKFNLR